MLDVYVGHWWVLTVRGVLAIAFGLMALFWPGLTLLVLAVVFGVYALIDGVLAGYAATRAAKGQRGWLIFTAVVGVLAGVAAVLWPGVTVLVLTLLVGFWAIVIGVMEIVVAWRIRKEIKGEALIMIAGALAILFGVLVLIAPALGAISIALLIGFYAILAGVALVALSLRVRKRQRSVTAP
ncbi:HdeD family acid-resistance protein [Nonomuraea sp. NPDC048826]|uniref:HdeD family acid-resistance protein n=1 Tax=Nonomuraea sp. NPDC048826 TaxID=3364347 RepID=UPI00372028A5